VRVPCFHLLNSPLSVGQRQFVATLARLVAALGESERAFLRLYLLFIFVTVILYNITPTPP
jgi:hypothetical protein